MKTNNEKIKEIESVRMNLVNELVKKTNEISDTSNLYKKGARPHKYGGWADADGDVADVTYDGLVYNAVSGMHKYFSIDDLQEMIKMADKLLACIDDNINKEYQKALELK